MRKIREAFFPFVRRGVCFSTPHLFSTVLFAGEKTWKSRHRAFFDAFSDISVLHSVADNGSTVLVPNEAE